MLKHATQKQIDSDAYSVVVYDHLDRTVYTGEWKTNRDRAAARAYFNDVQNQNNPVVDSLTPGTVTRTFYDRVPTDDTLNALNVKLIPAGEMLKYTRGRVAAVVSDVKAVLDDNGDPVPASNGKDSVIRVSTASSYDKYGRVVKAYAYDPTMPADSLKMLAVETEYDVGGKVLSTTKYPYGLKPNGMNRKITERYVYDRLGRVSDVYSKNGSGNKVPVAHYDYYPTGSVRTVKLGNSLTLSYTYHISGAVKTAEVRSADNRELYADTLYYEDCGNNACTPQYNGNISRMAHHLAHENNNYGEFRDVRYTYDELNRLTKVDDSKQDVFDEMFAYDAQGRITAQRRAGNVVNPTGGEYSYYSGKNRLKSVADNMGGTADERNMSDTANFVYDSVGNLTYDKSKGMKILYDWRGMPIEFIQQSQPAGSSSDTLFRLLMKYDGSGRRISKTLLTKPATATSWETVKVTHYTGIGTEIREDFSKNQTKVVVNMPEGLGRYGIEEAEKPDFDGMTGNGLVGYIPNAKFEWYLKNHLGSTMLVYGTQADANPAHSDIGTPLAAYDYRAFGEMVELTPPPTGKVTENFTGKEKDDETELNYFGARYLDPMLGMWVSVDPKRQFSSPYLYTGNGYNPIGGVDPSGMFYEDGERCTEGMFVPTEYQETVTPAELDELVAAERAFMASPGNVETLMSMAKYTLNHKVETRYWYNREGQNSFGYGKATSVEKGLGSGSYIHVHNWRSWTDTKNNEGLSWQNRPNKDGDLRVSRQIGGIMGYEIRTGRIYYGNKHKMADQFLLMQLPAGKVYDAQEYSGEMEDAR